MFIFGYVNNTGYLDVLPDYARAARENVELTYRHEGAVWEYFFAASFYCPRDCARKGRCPSCMTCTISTTRLLPAKIFY